MLSSRLPYLISLATFTFGAVAFSVLSVAYWRQRQRASGSAFLVFTVVCAVAFLLNLALQAMDSVAPAYRLFSYVLPLVTSLVPPMLLHLVSGAKWPRALAGFYCLSVGAAVLNVMDLLDSAPAVLLGLAGVLGLFFPAVEPGHRRWNRALLALFALCSGANIFYQLPLAAVLPDYLLLVFFCVTLYYRERLLFFDVFLKQGLFFAAVLPALAVFSVNTGISWTLVLSLVPCWLLAPWLYARLSGFVDRVWLRRPFSPGEAEREFAQDIQNSASEEDLVGNAARSAEKIFQAPCSVALDPAGITLAPRASGIPYLSDDHRLLQTLIRTLGVVAENVRYRQQQQELRLLASRAELKALRAQINPHFLFNALNTIAGLIREHPERADETVEQLAQVFRYTLRRSDNEWVSLAEEVEFVASYLNVERARFGERLNVEFDIQPEAARIPIPSMSIQPLVENAVKHGVSAVEGHALVRVSARLQQNLLWIEVLNTGPEFSASSGSGHGLKNIADRLAGYYGNRAELGWDHTDAGTRVYLRIPSCAS